VHKTPRALSYFSTQETPLFGLKTFRPPPPSRTLFRKNMLTPPILPLCVFVYFSIPFSFHQYGVLFRISHRNSDFSPFFTLLKQEIQNPRLMNPHQCVCRSPLAPSDLPNLPLMFYPHFLMMTVISLPGSLFLRSKCHTPILTYVIRPQVSQTTGLLCPTNSTGTHWVPSASPLQPLPSRRCCEFIF